MAKDTKIVSFEHEARRTSTRIATQIMGLFFLFSFAALTYYEIHHYLDRPKMLMKTLSRNLGTLASVGDRFHLDAQLKSLIDTDEFNAFWLYTPESKTPWLSQAIDTTTHPDLTKVDHAVRLQSNGLFIFSKHIIPSGNHAQDLQLIISQRVNLARPLFAFLALAGLLFVLWRFLTREVLRMSQTVVKPFVSLSNLVRHHTSDLGRAPKAELKYREVQEAFDQYRETIDLLKEAEIYKEQALRTETIIQTSQMIAHDFRKPLTQVEMFINELRNISRPDMIPTLIEKYVPILEASKLSVNNMMNDLMDISRPSLTSVQTLDPDSLCINALKMIAYSSKLSDPDVQISIEKAKIPGDKEKLQRVFANLVQNAIEATGGDCKIWILGEVIPESSSYRFTFGNSNSFIPQNIRTKIFEPFFTVGKSYGTGLGLGIASKIATLHNGSIKCRSDELKGTEFIVELPIQNAVRSNEKKERNAKLSEIIARPNKKFQISRSGPYIALVDDEEYYRKYFHLMWRQSDHSKIKIIELSAVNEEDFDILLSAESVIMDVDLGPKSMSGVEIAKSLRERGYKQRIILHSNSNRCFYEDDIFNLDLIFILKPVNINILTDLFSDYSVNQTVAVIDDNLFFAESWAENLKRDGIKPLIYTHPDDFKQELLSGKIASNNLSGVIVDRFYPQLDLLETDFLSECQKHGFEGPFLMATDSANAGTTIDGFTVISKIPAPWTECQKQFESTMV